MAPEHPPTPAEAHHHDLLPTSSNPQSTPPANLTRHPTAPASTYVPSPAPSLSKPLSKSLSRVPTAPHPPHFTPLHETLFIATIVAAQLLTQACLAQSIAPLHIIGHTFNTTSPAQLSWLPAAFSLTVGTFILPAGRWGDLLGHKRLLVAGYIWFATWSIIAGCAAYTHSLPFFAFCRAMQGVGSAVVLPNGIAVLARTYPPGRRRDMVLSVFGAAAPGGFVLGAVGAGLFAQLVWWPWAYWVLGMVLGLVAVAAVLVIPPMPVVGGRPRTEEYDLVGTGLGVAGLVCFNFAWNQGPVAGWGTVYVCVLLVVGVVFMGVFVAWERWGAVHPLVPAAAFTRDTNLVFGCVAAGWASFGIWIYYYWQFHEILEHNSVLLTAAKNSPAAISGAIAALTTGFLLSKIQPGFIMLMSMTAFLTGTILIATNPVGRTYWAQMFTGTVVVSWGMDMSFPSGVIVLSNHMPPEQQGIAASLVNTVINYSISIGLGIAGTVEGQVNDGGRDLLAGYRGAWYVGMGLDSLGIVLACALILSWRATTKAREKAESKDKEGA